MICLRTNFKTYMFLFLLSKTLMQYLKILTCMFGDAIKTNLVTEVNFWNHFEQEKNDRLLFFWKESKCSLALQPYQLYLSPSLHSVLQGECRVISPIALLALPLHHYMLSCKESMRSLALQPWQLSISKTEFCLTGRVSRHQLFSLTSSPSPSLHSVLQGECRVISPLASLALPLHHYILSCKESMRSLVLPLPLQNGILSYRESIASLALQPYQLSLSITTFCLIMSIIWTLAHQPCAICQFFTNSFQSIISLNIIKVSGGQQEINGKHKNQQTFIQINCQYKSENLLLMQACMQGMHVRHGPRNCHIVKWGGVW